MSEYSITLYGWHDGDGEVYLTIEASSYQAAVNYANAHAKAIGYLVLSVTEDEQ